jgi:hypothetical protein
MGSALDDVNVAVLVDELGQISLKVDCRLAGLARDLEALSPVPRLELDDESFVSDPGSDVGA